MQTAMNNNPPLAADRAAHELVTLMRNTIATQPLPYQHGTNAAALESLHRFFQDAREIVSRCPDSTFAAAVAHMLNTELRPFTARWHLQSEKGVLASRDGGDTFRGELQDLQMRLQKQARGFHATAYGDETPWDEEFEKTPPAVDKDELKQTFEPLRYGIPTDINGNGGISGDIADKINLSEHGEIETRRGLSSPGQNPEPGHDAFGLAFSGGGIRSATFCLGVAQVLADKNFLARIDFLSTVSGGGYTGSFIARRLGEGIPPEQLGGASGPDPLPVRYLRRRAKFLAARSLWEAWGMVCATLAGMLMNWLVPLFLVIVAAFLTMSVKLNHHEMFSWAGAMGIVVLLIFFAALAYFFLLRASSWIAGIAGKLLGFSAALGGLLLVGWILDNGFDQVFRNIDGKWHSWNDLRHAWHLSPLSTWIRNHASAPKGIAALLAGVATLVPVILRFVPLLRSPKARKILNTVCLWVAGIIVPLLGVAVFYALCAVGKLEIAGHLPAWLPLIGETAFSGLDALVALAVFLFLLTFTCLDINLTSPFRLYRNGLRRTFVDKSEGPEELLALTSLNPQGTGPYHLINCTANLPTSRAVNLRERKCDFFLFSKYWTGSPVIGYSTTADWNMNGKVPDLASAVAISGAAFSTHMGLGSIAPLRALLTILNVRLGYWIHQPEVGKSPAKLALRHPGFTCLLREMTGLHMSEKQSWLNLSDGGHIENLATYELLRRRCKFIVCVDGEADPQITFQGFMTLVRHAQIDFGVRIDADLDDIRPDPTTGLSRSRSHYQLCRITYPASADGSRPEGTGLLLYLKLSATGNESELIKRYRGTHPDFPHQATLDQFFDEEQFEAYRQLGAHVAKGLFGSCLMDGKGDPDTVQEWFKRLAGNLLEPTKQADRNPMSTPPPSRT